LGLTNLFKPKAVGPEELDFLLNEISNASQELDIVIKEINKALNESKYLS